MGGSGLAVGSGGRLWVGQLDDAGLTVDPAGTSTPTGAPLEMAGSVRGETVEIYVLFETGEFLRFDGQRWASIHRFAPIPSTDRRGGVTWFGPGKAAAAAFSSNDVVRTVDGKTLVEPIDTLWGLTEVLGDPRLGLFVGTATGEIFSLEADAWNEIGDTGISVAVDAMAFSSRGRLLFAGPHGRFGEYALDTKRFCRAKPIASTSVLFISPLGDSSVLLSGLRMEGRSDLPLTLLQAP